jgi:hypothetical protein
LGENALCADLRPCTARSIKDRYVRKRDMAQSGWSRREPDITFAADERRDGADSGRSPILF